MSGAGVHVYWHECRRSDVPAHDRWLHKSESCVLQRLRIPKRRDDWRLGRWTAKQAVAAYLRKAAGTISLASIEIRPADSGAPEVFIPSGPAPVSISISHCNDLAVCAVTAPAVAMGCDVEAIERRSDALISDHFTEQEAALVAAAPDDHRPWVATLLWSAKESALKALHEGLRLDTRSVQVRFDLFLGGGAWQSLIVSAEDGKSFAGWWCRDQHFVRTMVAHPAPDEPAGPLTSAMPAQPE